MNVLDLLRLLRVEQWYKNVVIFISIIFSFSLFNGELIFLTFVGFISLCLASSSNYIINDIIDAKKDRYHPEKKKRPLASGRVNILAALFTVLILLNISFLISYIISLNFLFSIIALFILSQAYTFYLKNIAILDIIVISINFIIRAVSGTFIIQYPISPWVILSTFFISLFLVGGKRSVEISFNNSKKYRLSLKGMNKQTLEYISITSIVCVIVFFSIYSILNQNPFLLLSLPAALFIIFHYFNDYRESPEKIRNPEKFIFDKKVLLAIIIWAIILVATFYAA